MSPKEFLKMSGNEFSLENATTWASCSLPWFSLKSEDFVFYSGESKCNMC